MLNTTKDAVRAILKADPSLTPADRSRILAGIRNHGKEKTPKSTPPEERRIIRRAEAARRLGVSLRAIDTWAAQGILRKIKLPRRTRACGFSSTEIERLATGGE